MVSYHKTILYQEISILTLIGQPFAIADLPQHKSAVPKTPGFHLHENGQMVCPPPPHVNEKYQH
jgi:hypothetical protein